MHPKLTAALAALVALAALTFAGQAQAATITADGLYADTYGQPTTGRVFLFHGMNDNRGFVQNQPYKPLLDGLVAKGWQVVVPDEPYDHQAPMNLTLRSMFQADTSHGNDYRTTWARDVHDLVTEADRILGPAPVNISGGISWGGFHALLAACTTGFDGYFAQAPVVDPNALGEFSDLPLENLKLWECTSALAAKNGFISWNGSDTRVETGPVQRLLGQIANAGASIASVEHPTLEHVTTPETMQDVLHWISQYDRPAPAASAAPVSSSAAPAQPVTPAAAAVTRTKTASRCTRARGCRNVVRRGRFFHVYGRGRTTRWVYVRRAR